MITRKVTPILASLFALSLLAFVVVAASVLPAQGQSSRPRRVKPAPSPTPDSLLGPEPKPSPVANNNAPLLDVKPSKPVGNAPASTDTTHAFQLFQQKEYAGAAKEAKEIATADPGNAEAWKLAGFSEFYLKQYSEAADDLQKALDLQRRADQEDAHTVDALAQSYTLAEKFDRALPLLVTVTTRKGATPDPQFIYYRGLAEYKTGKIDDAEKTFNAAAKANPKDAASLLYLGQIALARKDLDAAIAALNRATANDPKLASAWWLLTSSYLRRATSTNDETKANADYLGAVRTGEALTRLRSDEEAVGLYARALIGAQQYPRAATVLEKVATDSASGITFYLLGLSYSRANNFPKAIAALERAVVKTPNDVNSYRELGYDYEKTKQYAKAFATYDKALKVAPDDADFKEALERVRPFAKS
ncbi:MAG TPA: tetratricopeptide repeat protein [Pyrinomonadaceae bacterium]|nr:tetratricopeptide repeat protein [Pyrinomonadaceae bacterium]